MKPTREPAVLDAIDRKLLKLLIEDGGRSNHELAQLVGLSAAPLSRRLQRLREEQVYRDSVVVDPHAVGLGFLVFLEVTLDRAAPKVADRFVEAVRRIDAVVECHAIAGNFDFLLKIAVKDVTAYRRLVWEEFEHLPEIRQLRSAIVLDSPKLVTSRVP